MSIHTQRGYHIIPVTNKVGKKYMSKYFLPTLLCLYNIREDDI